MSRESMVLLSGILVTALPYLGLPTEWKRYGLALFGILLIVLGYSLRRSAFFRSIEVAPGERRGEAFVEHASPKRTDIEHEVTL